MESLKEMKDEFEEEFEVEIDVIKDESKHQRDSPCHDGGLFLRMEGQCEEKHLLFKSKNDLKEFWRMGHFPCERNTRPAMKTLS